MSRYVIAEVHGFLGPRVGGVSPAGLSVVVTDSLDNHRIVGQFRSEDRGSFGGAGRYLGREGARRLGGELVARLSDSNGRKRRTA